MLVSGRVDDDVVDVHDNVADAIQDLLHKLLKWRLATQESHRRSDPLKLTMALDCECG